MKKKIIVLDANLNSRGELSDILNSRDYPFTNADALSTLEEFLTSDQYVAVVVDIDSVSVYHRVV